MDQTINFALPCPSDEDYAALPLYMQRLAEATEAQVLALRTDLNAALKPPTAIWVNGSTSGPIGVAPGFAQFILNPPTDLLFSNYTVAGLAPSIGGSNQPFPSPGIYLLVWSCALTNTGAATNGCWKQLAVKVYQDTSEGSIVVADGTVRVMEVDSLTSGPPLVTTISGQLLFEVGDDPTNYHVSVSWAHTNAASNVQVTTYSFATGGGLTLALMRVGGNDVIEVV